MKHVLAKLGGDGAGDLLGALKQPTWVISPPPPSVHLCHQGERRRAAGLLHIRAFLTRTECIHN